MTSNRFSVLVLAATACASAVNETHASHDDHGGHHGGEFHHFNVIIFTVIFVGVVWVAGKTAAARGGVARAGRRRIRGNLIQGDSLDRARAVAGAGSPSLVGEIVAGVILGPHLLDFVPNAAVLKVIGEVGLVFHALEAFVVGASMASISTGIALNVLRVGSVLNQPIGQLIIAAATVNEVVNIALLTDHVVHETWDRQVKRVAHWLMRFFFACTIGFSIPIAAVARADVFVKALLLCCTIVGKLAVGVFAQPLDADHFWILALAWGEWGEMQCRSVGAYEPMTYAPSQARCRSSSRPPRSRRSTARGRHRREHVQRRVPRRARVHGRLPGLAPVVAGRERRAKFQIAEAIADTADVSGAAHATYFCLQTKSHAHWDQSDHLQTSIARLGCEIIDYRQWHPNDHFGLAHCVNEVYIRDDALRLPTAMEMTTTTSSTTRPATPDGGSEASSTRGTFRTPGIARDAAPRLVRGRPRRTEAVRVADVHARAHGAPGLSAETLSAAVHVEAHHELDGFVHHDAHHPFALPDDDDHEKEDDLVFGRHRAPSMSSVDLEEEKRADWHHHDVEVASDSGFAQTLVEVGSPRVPRPASSPDLATPVGRAPASPWGPATPLRAPSAARLSPESPASGASGGLSASC
ncbi:Sodium/hydrogen exchanger protein [Aureococcus anophagefferens]|uniref:Sodium/hydrogen exchanger protein n=1 Tax=Aureococcus anophagefferens TaxID=44056 RepID=A0ABR1FK56_AURAN